MNPERTMSNILLGCIWFYEWCILYFIYLFNILLDLWAVTCFSKALGTSLRSSDRLWLIRSLRLFSMICEMTRAERPLTPSWTTKVKRLRSKTIIHSPLVSSFGPESVRRSQETWTQWLGCTMEVEGKKERDGGMAQGKHGHFDSPAYCYHYPP